MKRRRPGWLVLAARAHEALMQHRCRLAEQARAEARDAEQRNRAAARAVEEVCADWAAARRHAALDPALDLAYGAYHLRVSRQACGARDQHGMAEVQVEHATAALKAAHDMNQVLDELLARREREQTVADRTQELRSVTESWILTRQHQLKGASE
jgi:hypothetical protein